MFSLYRKGVFTVVFYPSLYHTDRHDPESSLLIIELCLIENPMSRDMTKPTKCVCAQRRLRSAWASAKSDQILHCPHEETLGP